LRDQDFRHSRRRDFDADIYPQPRAFGTRPRLSQPWFEAPSGPPVHGVVKWFSPDKGFGFVALSDGVDSSTAATATPRRSNFAATTPNGSSSDASIDETGTVKWFNVEKGYGFISLDGGNDVFVHVSALERSGITSLAEGQPVIVDVIEGRKGLEATRIRLI